MAAPAVASAERIQATLTGYEEMPAVSTDASGGFRAMISRDNQAIDYELTYSGTCNSGSSWNRVGDLGPILAIAARSEPRQHAGQDLRPGVVFIAEPGGAALTVRDLAAALPPPRPTGRCLDRQVRDRTRAPGSPKVSCAVELGRNPGSRCASHSRRRRRGGGMRVSWPDFCAASTALPAAPRARFPPLIPTFSPTHFHEDL